MVPPLWFLAGVFITLHFMSGESMLERNWWYLGGALLLLLIDADIWRYKHRSQ